MFCPFSSGHPPRANGTQTIQSVVQQQQPLNLKHLSEAVRTLTSPPVSEITIYLYINKNNVFINIQAAELENG